MVSLQTQFAVFMTASSLGAFVLGALIFLPGVGIRTFCYELIHTDWKYIGVAWAITNGVNAIAHRFHADRVFTEVVYGFEGRAVLVFQEVTSTPLTVGFGLLYLVGFPFVVLFTYFKLKAHDEREAHRYALAYVCLVLAALPLFVFFPVGVTAYYLPGVEPLLYELDPMIAVGIASTDTLVKAFPSLHAGLTILAALYARKAGGAYPYVAWALTIGIVLSTLYLGIHWLSDIAIAIVLVGVAYWVSRRIDPKAVLPVPRTLRSIVVRPGRLDDRLGFRR